MNLIPKLASLLLLTATATIAMLTTSSEVDAAVASSTITREYINKHKVGSILHFDLRLRALNGGVPAANVNLHVRKAIRKHDGTWGNWTALGNATTDANGYGMYLDMHPTVAIAKSGIKFEAWSFDTNPNLPNGQYTKVWADSIHL